MVQERQRRGDWQPPAPNGANLFGEWRTCGLYALFLLGMAFLPLSAAADYMTQQHRPAGTILLSAMYLAFAIIGLWLLAPLRRMLRGESLRLRSWWAGLDLFLWAVAYDSLAHIWWQGPLPTFDQLLPNGSAGFVRQAIFFAGLVWTIVALQVIPMLRDARQRRLSAPPPSAR